MPRDPEQAEIERLVRPLINLLDPVLTRAEVGELLGLKRSRIHQIECQALYKLYLALKAEWHREVIPLEDMPLPADKRYYNLHPSPTANEPSDDAAGEKTSGATARNCDNITPPSKATGNAMRDVARVVTPSPTPERITDASPL
jgi:hypothetical protein